MCTIINHCRQLTWSLAQEFILHDYYSYTSHREILLCTSVDSCIFRNVHRTAHDIRTHISNQRHLNIWITTQLSTIDGIVGSDVQIVCISWLEAFKLRIESIVGVGRGCDLHDLTKMLCLFHCLLGPSTRIDIGSLLDEEVGRNLHELQ